MKATSYFKVFLLCAYVASVTPTPINCDINYLYRSYDGTCNNLINPEIGSSNTFFIRGPEGVEYADNISIPVIRPNERIISNLLSSVNATQRDDIHHSLFSVMFGQFIDHDLTINRFTPTLNESIALQDQDDIFCTCRNASGALNNCCINPAPFLPPAQISAPSSIGQIINGTFQIINNANSYLDLSQIYSNNNTTASFLRTFSGGKLLLQNYTGISALFGIPYSFNNILPSYNATGGNIPTDPLNFLPFPLFPNTELFVSGDERVAQNVALNMFDVLFKREHNRIAQQLALENPFWNDEKLFQESRKLNIAQYQNIVFYEFLIYEFGFFPFFLFANYYEGYNNNTNPSTPILFATSAFRYGHSTISSLFALDKCGNSSVLGQPFPIPLPFNGVIGGPTSSIDTLMLASSYEHVIRGLIDQNTHSVTVGVDDILRNILFFAPNGGGTDLMALDLLRGRLNGIPNYAQIRKSYHGNIVGEIYGKHGCPQFLSSAPNVNDTLACFFWITFDQVLAQKLKDVYGKINKIDAFIGLLAERPKLLDSSFPFTLSKIILSHFKNVRDGDRFWFENPGQFNSAMLFQIKNTKMSDLLRRNFANLVIPDNAFLRPENYRATLANSTNCVNP